MKTLKERARELLEQGRVDIEKGLYRYGVHDAWHPPSSIITRLIKAHEGVNDLQQELNEAYAALALLEGSFALEEPKSEFRPRWISVEEQETPKTEPFLAYYPHYFAMSPNTTILYLHSDGSYRSWFEGFQLIGEFTHWMQIPESPQEANA